MKIRISDQSLRVRLSGEEAMQLSEGQTLQTTLRLNAIDSFEFALQSWHLAIGEVHEEPGRLLISIPTEAAQRLATERDYRFTTQQNTDSIQPLVITIEIDLQKTPHA
jgi:hypothetical protein